MVSSQVARLLWSNLPIYLCAAIVFAFKQSALQVAAIRWTVSHRILLTIRPFQTYFLLVSSGSKCRRLSGSLHLSLSPCEAVPSGRYQTTTEHNLARGEMIKFLLSLTKKRSFVLE